MARRLACWPPVEGWTTAEAERLGDAVPACARGRRERRFGNDHVGVGVHHENLCTSMPRSRIDETSAGRKTEFTIRTSIE
jgi:hypothetical protein